VWTLEGGCIGRDKGVEWPDRRQSVKGSNLDDLDQNGGPYRWWQTLAAEGDHDTTSAPVDEAAAVGA